MHATHKRRTTAQDPRAGPPPPPRHARLMMAMGSSGGKSTSALMARPTVFLMLYLRWICARSCSSACTRAASDEMALTSCACACGGACVRRTGGGGDACVRRQGLLVRLHARRQGCACVNVQACERASQPPGHPSIRTCRPCAEWRCSHCHCHARMAAAP